MCNGCYAGLRLCLCPCGYARDVLITPQHINEFSRSGRSTVVLNAGTTHRHSARAGGAHPGSAAALPPSALALQPRPGNGQSLAATGWCCRQPSAPQQHAPHLLVRRSSTAYRTHTGSLSVGKVLGFQNHRPRAIPHRHSSWVLVHECEIQVYGIPVQMIPGLWNEIIGY